MDKDTRFYANNLLGIIDSVSGPAGIYIHVPFCERKCTYCNFNTTDFDSDLAVRYVDAVAREIAYWGERSGQTAVDSIYFGGGTPSILEAGQIASLIDACRRSFDLSRKPETTLEINPGTLTRRKVGGWREAGVTRVSVGAQSFIDRELVQLSRTHTSDETRLTIEMLREASFRNISIDLIAGLPDQSLRDWELNLREALRIRPEHLSLYLLEVKEGTQLFSQIKRGLQQTPDDDLAAEMYRMIREVVVTAGYEHYEISNFALLDGSTGPPSLFRSRHNLKYWTDAHYFGIGCGAHSYDGRSRRVNVAKTDSYIGKVAASGHAVGESRTLTDAERLEESLFMGLRLTEGISLKEVEAAHGVDVIARYGAEIDRLLEAGLIKVERGRLLLTEAGLPLSNEVFMAFV